MLALMAAVNQQLGKTDYRGETGSTLAGNEGHREIRAPIKPSGLQGEYPDSLWRSGSSGRHRVASYYIGQSTSSPQATAGTTYATR